tara:strand:+ start:8343 stop:9512 length:1170 start_codon:yes stop_codon:yes gene_type:complete
MSVDNNHVFFGDIKKILETGNPVPLKIIIFLLNRDILLRLKSYLLGDYKENIITFEPTYKRNPKTGYLSLIKKTLFGTTGRYPGYADRIFYKTNLDIKKVKYNSLSITGSDHFPVYLSFLINNIKICVVTWNIGSCSTSKYYPHLINKLLRNESYDILILGLQESCIYSNPDLIYFKNIYNSKIEILSNDLRSILGRVSGFGIKSYVFWNSNNINVDELIANVENKDITKGSQYFGLRIYDNVDSVTLSLCNTHSPFTSEYSKFYKRIISTRQYLNSQGDPDIYILFGDLNSRSSIRLKRSDKDKKIYFRKNIKIKKNSKRNLELGDINMEERKNGASLRLDLSRKSFLRDMNRYNLIVYKIPKRSLVMYLKVFKRSYNLSTSRFMNWS